MVDPLKVPAWVVSLFNKMKDRKKDEQTYLPVEKEDEDSDQLPGRTDSWYYHYRGYQPFAKLNRDKPKRVLVMVVVDSSICPVSENNYLLEDVIKFVIPGSSLLQMHAIMDQVVNHVAIAKLIVFCNVIDDLAEKKLFKYLLEGKPKAMTSALQSLLEDMSLVQRKIQDSIRGMTMVAFASPPGFAHWDKKPLQMLVYALWEFSKFDRKDAREEIMSHFRICAPNLRVHRESLRLSECNKSYLTPDPRRVPSWPGRNLINFSRFAPIV